METVIEFLQPLFGNVANLSDFKLIIMWVIGGILI